MKINVNSWHYKVMSLYKWSRKEESDWTRDHAYWEWSRTENGRKYDHDATGSLAEFRAFMQDTGTFQPVDFCTYWRNVLVWPLLFVLMWSLTVGGFLYAMTYVTSTGTMVIGAVIAFIVGIAVFVSLVGWLWSKLPTRKVADKVESFFGAVGDSLRNPELCSLVEYEKDDA